MEGEQDWYKDAVLYQLRVRSFCGDQYGRSGDFRTLRERLPYIKDLGASCIWLLPIHPSPLEDDGYDVADYRGIHPNYGDLEDFKEFLIEAHRIGLKVIMDLVLNHTSDRHPWFEESRRSKDSARRDWYVWSRDDKKYDGVHLIFRNREDSNWQFDPHTGEYYWHRFYRSQPDLNYDNPEVVRETLEIADFWLGLGVDGFRLDAVHTLFEREGTSCEHLPETHAYIKRLRSYIDERHSGKVLLAEAVAGLETIRPYFADGDECQMAFHFPLATHIFYALASGDKTHIESCLLEVGDLPSPCQWALMLRNHDDLTVKFLSDGQRREMMAVYAAESGMGLNDGIRRRLAPMLENDPSRLRLVHALIFSLPGSPVLYYGDELCLEDDLSLPDRYGLRLPMDWAGVEEQQRDPESLLNWVKRALSLRKAHPVFGRGRTRFIRTGDKAVLACLRELGGEAVLVLFNLSAESRTPRLDLGCDEHRSLYRNAVDLWSGAEQPLCDKTGVELPPFAFRWLGLR